MEMLKLKIKRKGRFNEKFIKKNNYGFKKG